MAAHPRLTALAAKRAAAERQPFVELHRRDFLPAVAVSYPAGELSNLRAWIAGNTGRISRSDDFMLGRWAREWKRRVLVAVPSIVQHPDDTPSLIGNGVGAHGRNPARTALFFD
jgi:hypothetical protein